MTVARLPLYTAIAQVFFFAACAANRGPQPLSTAPSLESANLQVWHVTFHLSGGLSGIDRVLELASTGEVMVEDRRRGAKVTAQAPASDLSQVALLVGKLEPVDPVRETNCRDCLRYDINIHAGGHPVVAQFNDVTLAGTAFEGLVRTLRSLLDRALAGNL